MSADWAPPGSASAPGAGAPVQAGHPVAGRPDSTPVGAGSESPSATLSAAGVAVARCDAPWPEDEGAGGEFDDPLSALSPVGVGGVLDGGFELLRSRFGLLVGTAAALFLPLQLLEVLAALSAGLDAQITTGGLGGSLELLGSGATTGVDVFVLVARVMALSLLGLLCGVMVSDLLGGRRRTGGSLLRLAGGRWWVALVLPLLCVPVKAVGSCLVYVGFFLADALLMCASVAAGAERLGPFASFGRSWRLALRHYGTAIGVSVGAFFIALVLQAALFVGPVLLAGQFLTSESALLVVQQVALLSLLVVQPLTACIAARAYVELRCRAEGLDIELRRARIGLL